MAALERRTDQDWLLTLEQPVDHFGPHDAVDNVSWYTDVSIRDNTFIKCANPVISVNPHNGNDDPSLPVHENIRIGSNFLVGGGISAKSVRGLVITGNRFTANSLPVQTKACTDVVIERNLLKATR